MDKVSAYIQENWNKTIHSPDEMVGKVKVDRPYMSPCIVDVYTDLYYWDTYFINLGLMFDGYDEQVQNNLDNIAKFINILGYMPNANSLADRSQPPLFTRGVYDFYMHKKDIKILERYIDVILKEYRFWNTNRKNKIGLSSYGNSGSEADILYNYEGLHERVEEYAKTPEEKIIIGKDIMAIAESGLDFNLRFRTPESKIAAHEFSHLDLDCILYDVEKKISIMLRLLERNAESEEYEEYAIKRRELINKYYFDKEKGIYLDYNMKTGKFSEVLTAISFYPYTFGISNDQNSALRVLKQLELSYGLSVAVNRGSDIYFQWDYPCMWPAATCLTYMGLKDIGLIADAKRIAQKYNTVVSNIFEKTGRIWEKYDASNGQIAVTSEYATMEMMGWTAGVYRFFAKELA